MGSIACVGTGFWRLGLSGTSAVGTGACVGQLVVKRRQQVYFSHAGVCLGFAHEQSVAWQVAVSSAQVGQLADTETREYERREQVCAGTPAPPFWSRLLCAWLLRRACSPRRMAYRCLPTPSCDPMNSKDRSCRISSDAPCGDQNWVEAAGWRRHRCVATCSGLSHSSRTDPRFHLWIPNRTHVRA